MIHILEESCKNVENFIESKLEQFLYLGNRDPTYFPTIQ